MRPRLKSLGSQAIVITGASSGIGLVTAKKAAAAGARVLLVARNEGALAAAVAEIRAGGGVAEFAVADTDDRAAVDAAADKAVAAFGGIDTWVNNAGVAIYAPLLDTPEDAHRRMMRTNYFGAVNGCLAAVPHLRGQGGAIVTVASVAADMPAAIMGAYAATKHALKAYVEALRIELGAAGAPIAVSLVKPSGIDTPIAEHALNRLDGEARIPPVVYDPALVADAILACAVDGRREITVGGAGRMQALFAEHFPALFERLAPLMIPLLVARDQPKTAANNLTETFEAGRERSRLERGRSWSGYTEAKLHPGAAALALGIGGLLLAGSVLSAVRPRLPR